MNDDQEAQTQQGMRHAGSSTCSAVLPRRSAYNRDASKHPFCRSYVVNAYQQLKRGYADLLDAPSEVFDRKGITIIETARRDRPEWANWVMPIWLLKIEEAIVCSVTPFYAPAARAIFSAATLQTLLDRGVLVLGQRTVDSEWIQREILFYNKPDAPNPETNYAVELLDADTPTADRLLAQFDGGVYAIRDDGGGIAAHAGIKNKGIIREIAVGTEPHFQRRGMGKAVVAHAVAAIMAQGNVPVYVPDTPNNVASYALADALGFKKGAEALFCEYELLGWHGFTVT